MVRVVGFLISTAFRTLLIGCTVYLYMEVANPAVARRIEASRNVNAPVFTVLDRNWDRFVAAAGLPTDWYPYWSVAPRLLRQARARRDAAA